MEGFARALRLRLKMATRFVIPHFRQFLRFLGLPYCFLFLVNWKECTASPVRVAGDLLYIFFVLRSYPDNYSNCRLYELPRAEWDAYYGSNYNPFQRGRLFRQVQPPEYQVVFEDKEVCQRVCEGLGFPVPRMLGSLDSTRPLAAQLSEMLKDEPDGDFFAKAATGAAGSGVFKIRKVGPDFQLSDGRSAAKGTLPTLGERHILQAKVEQIAAMARVFPGSLNSLRVLTLLTHDGRPMVISGLARFGSGQAEVDNWSAGGVAVGLDYDTGRLDSKGFNKKGHSFTAHPDSGVVFADFVVPDWPAVRDFSGRVQAAFPYYRLIGLDIALSDDGPVLVEINAYPDFVGQEQCAGPLLKDPRVLREFGAYDLLYNGKQKALLAKLKTGEVEGG